MPDVADELELLGFAEKFLERMKPKQGERSFTVIDLPLDAHSVHGGPLSSKGSHVFVTIGVAETHVTVYAKGMEKRRHHVVDGGWGELRKYPLISHGQVIHLDTIEMIEDGLSGNLMLFGKAPDLSGFKAFSRNWFVDLVKASLEKTIGHGAQYDAITVNALSFLSPALESVQDLRPHLKLNLEDI